MGTPAFVIDCLEANFPLLQQLHAVVWIFSAKQGNLEAAFL